MTHGNTYSSRNRTLLMLAVAVAIIIAFGVAVTVYPAELRLARPDDSSKRVVVAVAEIDAMLDGEADFVEFSETLRSALAGYRALPERNAADNRLGHALDGALDCYMALRESWQMELEGAWDPATQGDPSYWRSFHHAVELPAVGPLSPAEVRESLKSEALAYAEEALSIVER